MMRSLETRTRLMLVTFVLVALIAAPCTCSGANLLTNPGWETSLVNVQPPWISPYVNGGWTYIKTDGSGNYFWRESECTGYSTGPLYHEGSQALRVESNWPSATAMQWQAYQDVGITGGQSFTASAWVVTVDDVNGTGWGFGSTSDDWAGVVVEELNSSDAVIATHQAGFTNAVPTYREATVTFETLAAAVKLRFKVSALMHGNYTQGHVSFDDTSLVTAAGPPPPSNVLVGQWTFDHYGGTGPLENKAPGVTWSTLAYGGYGGKVSNGSLVLPTWYNPSNSTYYQSYARTMLQTDLGPSGYFQDSTVVIWIKWPGYDPSFKGCLTTLAKFPTTEWSAPEMKTQETILHVPADTFADGTRWGSFRSWEQWWPVPGGTFQQYSQWARPGTPYPDTPTDKWVKIAQVISVDDHTIPDGTVTPTGKWHLTMYGDFGDGNGLVQIGGTASWPYSWSWVNFFGQAGSNCLENPATGPRYDGFGLMDWQNWVTPQAEGQIEFDEARIYSGVLTRDEIAALAPVTGRTVGSSTKALYDPLAQLGAKMADWTLWGKVTPLDPPDEDNFSLDDGSGKPVQVFYPGHGLIGGEFVTVTGSVEFNELGGPILRAGSLTILN
ncbi:MAG: hypothetical protein M1133_04785 [Armatimonadetes bacterium]|nr:hypothetical protein [Armatimonadota bacterium]